MRQHARADINMFCTQLLQLLSPDIYNVLFKQRFYDKPVVCGSIKASWRRKALMMKTLHLHHGSLSA